MIITKEDLISKYIYENEDYNLQFEKDSNRFLFMINKSANVLKLFKKDKIQMMIIISRDGILGLTIEETNRILKPYGFEISC
jgi:hypothetical protein